LNTVTYQAVISKNGVIKPKIPVKIVHPSTGVGICVLALLDTGADNCTFPSMVSRTIGLEINDNYKAKNGSVGISGKLLVTYNHDVLIQLLDPTKRKVIRTLKVKSSTLEKNDIPVILGTNNFLDSFDICFNYSKKEITLKWE